MSVKLILCMLPAHGAAIWLRPLTSARVGQQRMMAAPSKKIEAFQTVSVRCVKCSELLFRYKKKNGLKSKLVKCYVERIVADPSGLLDQLADRSGQAAEWRCPACATAFARDALIHGRPALKIVGGKVRMTK
eukprot:CAMPEP_0119378156 /NCGR_PEP_ID=MMETSP1334-20130426/47437_1 /TAXON_ID=127549 /ORGANISM="Calcidiscus leptoporus, Strain RCC1130" /LENGTH=131 /DNA_ID=CAMNT_0007397277 /DNA_START=54 /DNA_END=449 /DNA_ORIENTATION=+